MGSNVREGSNPSRATKKCIIEPTLVESNRNLAEKTWLTDHIAYIVACEYDPRTSTRRYVRWINPDIEIDKFPVNQSELKKIVSDEIAETETAVRYSKSVRPAAE